MAYLNYFQMRMPHVTRVHEKMQCLLHFLNVNAVASDEEFSFCFEGDFEFTCDEKEEMIEVARSAFEAAHSKLAKYVVDGAQPAAKFLEQVRVLDPTNLADCERSQASIDSIPGVESVSKEEWKLYVDHLGPQAVKSLKDGEELDLKQFWKSKASSLPEVYKVASSYCTTTVGSYDVERSFSSYNAILDAKRRSLDQKTMKAFHFLNWNLQLKSAAEEEKEEIARVQEESSISEKARKQTQGNQPQESSISEKARKQTQGNQPQESSISEKVRKQTQGNQPQESSISEKARKQTQGNDQGLASKAAKKESQNSLGDSSANNNQSNDSTIEEVSLTKGEEVLKEEPSSIPEKGRKRKASLPGNSDVAKKGKSAKKGNALSAKPGPSLNSYFSSAPKESVKKEEESIPSGVSQQATGPLLRYGLDPSVASKINVQETSCSFPKHKEPLLDCLLDGTVKSNVGSIIDGKDLEALVGGHPLDEDNYLSNFVIEAYLNLLVNIVPAKTKVEVIEWEKFEKGVGGSKPVKKVLKGKAPLLAQDVVFIPCNTGQSKHWFILVVLPMEKKIVALDSLAGAFIKPTVNNAIKKMWRLLEQLDPTLDVRQWYFSCNSPQDIPQQSNGFDCGVYLCLYARSFLLQSPIVSGSSIPSFRKQMILELHQKKIQNFGESMITEGKYYAVEYQKTFYFGRALNYEGKSFIKFKFLHSTGARIFDWPLRDLPRVMRLLWASYH